MCLGCATPAGFLDSAAAGAQCTHAAEPLALSRAWSGWGREGRRRREWEAGGGSQGPHREEARLLSAALFSKGKSCFDLFLTRLFLYCCGRTRSAQVDYIALKFPEVLRLSWQNDMEPVLAWLGAQGLRGEELSHVLAACPRVGGRVGATAAAVLRAACTPLQSPWVLGGCTRRV